MHALSNNDIISELSYAYLHAVASAAQASCSVAARTEDANGIDAKIDACGNFGGYLTNVALNVQLKATTQTPLLKDGYYSFFLDKVHRYDDLRMRTTAIPRILVVLFLPEKEADWLQITPDKLILQRAAYWISLYDAPASTNTSGVTVYLPELNLFTPRALTGIFTECSHNRRIPYTKP